LAWSYETRDVGKILNAANAPIGRAVQAACISVEDTFEYETVGSADKRARDEIQLQRHVATNAQQFLAAGNEIYRCKYLDPLQNS
jgi:hypothetical protein